jgi:oligopeptide/dipeptide ABC transporter ATP-binding protein
VSAAAPILAVEGLTVAVGDTPIVRDVSLSLAPGKRIGLVGESGCGKTVTAMAVMGLLRRPLERTAGRVMLDDTDLAALGRRRLDRLRGSRIAMVYQDPMASLNPLQRVGRQVVEAVRLHSDVSRGAARARAVELLDEVGIPDPAARVDSYPHELSGGMRQRVMIAMALAGEPEVLLCDEPTTALDVTTQRRIVELLTRISDERRLAIVLITHDLGVAAGLVDEVAVMYAGRIVERAPVGELYTGPRHPYTEALLGAACDLTLPLDQPIPTIPGQPPLPAEVDDGCSFRARCRYAQDLCAQQRPLLERRDGGPPAACHFPLHAQREPVANGEEARNG